jgi:glc operon protein GlcG
MTFNVARALKRVRQIADFMLKLAEANRAIVAAQAYASDHRYSISVTVCDSTGHLIAHQRMDDALPLSSYGSVGKAIASAGLGLPSGEESDMDLRRSPISGVLAHGLAIIRRPGGLPIKLGGKVEGAIGVSGAPTDEENEECARRGIEAISS